MLWAAWKREFDIADFFGSIGHDEVMGLVERRISDRRTLKLIRQWLEAGVMVDGAFQETVSGTPQGGVMAPQTQVATSSLRSRSSDDSIVR